MRTLGTQTWFGARLMVSRSAGVFDEAGNLKDATVEEAAEAVPRRLRQFLRRPAG